MRDLLQAAPWRSTVDQLVGGGHMAEDAAKVAPHVYNPPRTLILRADSYRVMTRRPAGVDASPPRAGEELALAPRRRATR